MEEDTRDDFEIEYDEYFDALKINMRDVETAMSRQAGLYARVSCIYADLRSYQDSAKMFLEDARSKLSLKNRKELEERGEKYTEAKIDSMIQTDEEYVKAKEDYIELGRWVLRYEGLLESYKQRNYMLCELNRKTAFEMSMGHS